MITTQQLDDLNAKLERATKNAALHNLRKYRAVLPWDWLGDLMTHGKNRIWAKLSPQEILAMADEDLTKLAQDSNEFRKAIRRRKVTTSLEDLLKKGDLKDLGRGAPSLNPRADIFGLIFKGARWDTSRPVVGIASVRSSAFVQCAKDDPRHEAYVASCKTNRLRLEALREIEAGRSPKPALAEPPKSDDLPVLLDRAQSQMDNLTLRIVGALPEPHKSLFMLQWLGKDEGLAIQEGAKLLGLSQPTAHRKLEVARETVGLALTLCDYENSDLKRRFGPDARIDFVAAGREPIQVPLFGSAALVTTILWAIVITAGPALSSSDRSPTVEAETLPPGSIRGLSDAAQTTHY